MRKFLLAGCLLAALVLTGCPESESSDPKPQVAKPTVDLAGGKVAPGTWVTLDTDTVGAEIHYTLDGEDPTAGSKTYRDGSKITLGPAVYVEPETVTLKAIAVKAGMVDSAIVEATWVVDIDAPEVPVLTKRSGAIAQSAAVEIQAKPGAVIRYTTDGSDPTPAKGEGYFKPLELAKDKEYGTVVTLKTLAVEGDEASPIRTATYKVAQNFLSAAERLDGAEDIVDTTGISLTFDGQVTELKLEEIEVSPGSGPEGGIVTVVPYPDSEKDDDKFKGGDGATFTVPIRVEKQGYVSVKIKRADVTSDPIEVLVYKHYIDDYLTYNVTADGESGVENSKAITITFNNPTGQSLPVLPDTKDLTAEEITVAGVSIDALNGGWPVYTLALTGVEEEKEVTVQIAKLGVEKGAKTVAVNKDTTPPAEVKNLRAEYLDRNINLVWGNPDDTSLKALKITWASNAIGAPGGDTTEPYNGQTIQSYTVGGLINAGYTLTVQTVDEHGNHSKGEDTYIELKDQSADIGLPYTPPRGELAITVTYPIFVLDEDGNQVDDDPVDGTADEEDVDADGITLYVLPGGKWNNFSSVLLTATPDPDTAPEDTDPDEYVYSWFVDGVATTDADEDEETTLTATDYSLKRHKLTVVVEAKNSTIPGPQVSLGKYSKDIYFTVKLEPDPEPEPPPAVDDEEGDEDQEEEE